MPDVSELLQYIHDLVVTPLRNFEQVANEGDQIHTDYYRRFTANINSLFGDPPAIAGGGADALQAKMDEYNSSEANETGFGDGSLSAVIDQAGTYCRTAANNIQSMIDNFPSFGLLQAIEDGILPPLAITNTPIITVRPERLKIARFINMPNNRYQVSLDQYEVLKQMGDERALWEANIEGLFGLEQNLPAPPNNLPMSFITLPPVNLSPEQQQEVNDIMQVLETQGMDDINQQYIEELVSEGFSEGDIITAIEGWKAAGMSDQQINDQLYLAAFHILLGPYYHNDMVPNGMTDQQYQNFVSTLRNGLNAAGYCSGAGIGGSTVTGYKYTSGRPFDGNPNDPSDYDIALTGAALWQRAKELGIRLRDGGTHTGPLTPVQLQELGLADLVDQLEAIAGPGSPTGHRDVHFMIYNSLTTTSARAPYMYFFGDSCAGN
ncbi:MAG TPA: hypothetical protein VFV38_48850 [Ktedonobacteraceae bacterium]|nr:hypothetical protein [Ktedonobacteraceae bacterium]